MLESDWLRETLVSFAETALIRKSPHAIKRIDACAVFLSELDQRNLSPADVTQPLLFSLLGREGLRRNFQAVEHLCRRVGIPWNYDQLTQLTEESSLQRVLGKVADRPWNEDLQRYQQYLSIHQTKSGRLLKTRTVKMYVHAAISLIKKTNSNSFADLSVDHIAQFLKDSPGHAASLHPLIKFIGKDQTSVLRLVLDETNNANQSAHERAVLKESRFLIDALNECASRKQALILISRILANLFGIPTSSILCLQWHNVIVEGSRCTFTLDDVVYSVEDPLRYAIAKWLIPNPKSNFVFSGRNALQPIHPATVRNHVRKVFERSEGYAP